MKTSLVDVRSTPANRQDFLRAITLRTAVEAALTEIEPVLDAGLNTKRPVAALRPSTEPLGFPDLAPVEWGRVVMT